jgi:hypothetical protein
VAGKGATLALRIVSDARDAAKGFEEAEAKVGGFQRGLDRASVAATGVLGGLGALGKQAFDSASDLQQATGAVEAVFGDMAEAVSATSRDAAQQFGLSAAEFSNSAALMGAQLQNMGFSADAAWDQTYALIGLGSDLAAQYGGTTQQAVEALSSALKGERDPIERYAVSLTQAAIDAKVAALGLDTSTDAAKRNADAQATLALITEQSSSAQGAFGREADTAAGQTQRASAEFENASAALGQALLPLVADGAQKLAAFAQWAGRNSDVIVPLVAVIGGLAAGILAVNAGMRIYSAVTKTVTAVQWLLNVAMSANPLGIIIIAITAIVAAVRDFIKSVGRFLGSVFDGFKDVLEWIIGKLAWIGDAATWVGDLFSAPVTVQATGVVSSFGAAPGAAAPVFGAAGGLGSAGSSGSAGSRGGSVTVVNVTVRDAIDPVTTGRTLEGILRKYARATGSDVSLVIR